MCSVMRKYQSFCETNLKYGIFSKTNFERNKKKKKKKCQQISNQKFQSSDYDRVGRVRGNKLIFNFGLMYMLLSKSLCKVRHHFTASF